MVSSAQIIDYFILVNFWHILCCSIMFQEVLKIRFLSFIFP